MQIKKLFLPLFHIQLSSALKIPVFIVTPNIQILFIIQMIIINFILQYS